MRDTSDRQRQLVAMLLAALSVGVPAAVALGLGLLGVGRGVSWGVACVAGVALGAVWYRWDRYPIPLIVIPIASALAPILVLGFVVEPALLLSGMTPRLTLEGARTSSASVVAIEGATVKTALVGRYQADADRTGGLGTEYFAAPLLPAHQPRSEPGAAWVICAGDSAGCAHAFNASPLVGVLRAPVASSEVPGGGAIDDAVAKHGLDEQEQLEVLSIDSSPALEAVVPILAIGFGMLVFGALVLLVTHVRARLRRKA